MKHTLRKITPLLVVFTVLLSSSFIDAAWNAPGGTPSEGNNADAPINVSATNQMKPGDITAVNLKAGNQMWSAEYCDENGVNCFDSTDVSTSSSSSGKIFTRCSNEDSRDPSNVPCYQAGDGPTGRYRAVSCASATLVGTGEYLYFNGTNWYLRANGGWYSCQNNTIVVMDTDQ